MDSKTRTLASLYSLYRVICNDWVFWQTWTFSWNSCRFLYNFRLPVVKFDRLLTFLICKMYPKYNLNLSHATIDVSVTRLLPLCQNKRKKSSHFCLKSSANRLFIFNHTVYHKTLTEYATATNWSMTGPQLVFTRCLSVRRFFGS